jgi:hypothetical protein
MGKRGDRSAEYRKRNMKQRTSQRSFEMVPDGIPAVQVVKTPVNVAAKIRKRIREELPGLTRRLTPMEFKFVLELYFGDSGGVQYKAYKAAMGKPNLKDSTAIEDASRMKRSILAKIGREGIDEIIGFTVERGDRTVLGLLDADDKRQFITRDGRIVEGETFPNYLARAKGVEFLYKRKGIFKEQEGAGPIVVNIVQYCGSDATPFTGGGRVGLDGVLRPTLGPGSHAALGMATALPAGPDPIGGNRGERDD